MIFLFYNFLFVCALSFFLICPWCYWDHLNPSFGFHFCFVVSCPFVRSLLFFHIYLLCLCASGLCLSRRWRGESRSPESTSTATRKGPGLSAKNRKDWKRTRLLRSTLGEFRDHVHDIRGVHGVLCCVHVACWLRIYWYVRTDVRVRIAFCLVSCFLFSSFFSYIFYLFLAIFFICLSPVICYLFECMVRLFVSVHVSYF